MIHRKNGEKQQPVPKFNGSCLLVHSSNSHNYLERLESKSVRSRNTHSQKDTVNPDYRTTVPKYEQQLFEYYKGGSSNTISDKTIDPHTTTTNYERYKREVGDIEEYSYTSKRRFNERMGQIDTSKCEDGKTLLITLTSPSVGWRDVSGEEWKRRLNNFLTQLRTTFNRHTLCGFWKMEFQRRGSVHFHIITYNTYIPYEWVSEKWNKICCKGLSFREQQKHLRVGTQVKVIEEMSGIKDYLNKEQRTQYYMTKNDGWKVVGERPNGEPDQQLLEFIKSFGRFWGSIRIGNLKKLKTLVSGEFETKEQYHKIRRVFRKYIQSIRKTTLGRRNKGRDGKVLDIKKGNNYNHKKGKLLNKIFSQKTGVKHNVGLPDRVFEDLLWWVGLDVSKFQVEEYEQSTG